MGAINLHKAAVIVDQKPNNYSETFIRNQIDYLKADMFFSNDFPHYIKPSNYKNGPISMFKFFYHWFRNEIKHARIKYKYKKKGITITIAEYGKIGARVYPFFKRTGKSLIVEFRGHDAFNEDLLSRFCSDYPQLFSVAKFIIVKSEQMKSVLISLGAAEEKVVHIISGVHTIDFHDIQPKYDSKTVLAFGRFVEKKAPHLTILAFNKVLQKVPDAKLIIAGDGPLLGVTKQIAKSLGIESHISFPGILNHEELKEAMRNSCCFVQHSIKAANGDSEGTPNSLIEAGSAGLPIIATKHGGILDVVSHDEDGFLVEEGDIEKMADYVSELLLNPHKASHMGKMARGKMAKTCDIALSIKKYEQIFESIAVR